MKAVAFMMILGLTGASISPAIDFGKMTGRGKEGGTMANDAKQVLTQGRDLLGYATLAVDQGIKAVDAMISMFPPEKVVKLREVAAKYHELSKARKDGNLDAEQIKLASDVAREAAALESDWQGYHKDKSTASRSAYTRLTLMLVADAFAAEQAPKTLSAIQNALSQIGSNPLQSSNLMPLKAQVEILGVLSSELPGQISSFTTVRRMTKKIAEAEKVQLPADPNPDDLKTKAGFAKATSQPIS